MSNPWPIIIVTGANAGVGFGICQRLIFQLSHSSPPDVQLIQTDVLPNDHDEEQFYVPCEGLTLIMACRSQKRAEEAKKTLFRLLDAHILKLKQNKDYDGHAERFRENLRIEIHELDLAMLKSVTKFAEEVQHKYPYISHLICNAGVGSFDRINIRRALWQLLQGPLDALTSPAFYDQIWGEIGLDGYGWIWQCNLFGHYFLYRSLKPLLLSPKYPSSSRVIWTSSLKAILSYTLDDFQLKETQDPYGAVKHQTELIATHLDRLELRKAPGEKRVRHLVTHPGVCSTKIASALIWPILEYAKVWLFYIARWLGSPNHTISYENGAIAVVWASVISLTSIASMFVNVDDSPKGKSPNESRPPIKFGSCTDRWGNPAIGLHRVGYWDAELAEQLVAKCEETYKKEKEHQQWKPQPETASERM